MGKCSLIRDGEIYGTCVWNADGANYNLYCACPFEEGYIYRVVLIGTDDLGELMGVMMPKLGKFVLYKNLPKSAEKTYGEKLNNIKCAEIIRTMPGEYGGGPLPFPLASFEPYREIAELGQAHPMLNGADTLVREFAGEIYLAAPISGDAGFALAPFFCMATPIEINKMQYGIVKFDKNFNAKIVNINQSARG